VAKGVFALVCIELAVAGHHNPHVISKEHPVSGGGGVSGSRFNVRGNNHFDVATIFLEMFFSTFLILTSSFQMFTLVSSLRRR